jgi:hypothetical protein
MAATPHTVCSSVPEAGGKVMLETPRWLVMFFFGTALVALVALVLYFLA